MVLGFSFQLLWVECFNSVFLCIKITGPSVLKVSKGSWKCLMDPQHFYIVSTLRNVDKSRRKYFVLGQVFTRHFDHYQ